jgi:carbon storage regulator CsrA
MLVLSRKSTERIQIGDRVVVTVLEIRGNNVRIGISAPREIRVLRSELKDVAPELSSDLVSDARGREDANLYQVLPSVVYT